MLCFFPSLYLLAINLVPQLHYIVFSNRQLLFYKATLGASIIGTPPSTLKGKAFQQVPV